MPRVCQRKSGEFGRGSAIDGYRLLDTNELISFSRTQPWPDGEYWVCRWGEGTRTGMETKCFFGSEIF